MGKAKWLTTNYSDSKSCDAPTKQLHARELFRHTIYAEVEVSMTRNSPNQRNLPPVARQCSKNVTSRGH